FATWEAVGRVWGRSLSISLTKHIKNISASSMGLNVSSHSRIVSIFAWKEKSFAGRRRFSESKLWLLDKATISKNIQPRENMSAGRPLGSKAETSGAKYLGVPRSPPSVALWDN